jgi:hypothetical protein
VKVGDLVQSADRVQGQRHRKRVGLIMEVDPDNYDAQCDHNTYFIQWSGDADWTFLYEDDFEVISESR